MKKATYILFIVLTLVSASRLTIDRHFCGGKVVDVKFEFSGKRASCGMEQDEQVCHNYDTYGVNCCHNETTTLLVDNYVISGSLAADIPYGHVTDIVPFVSSWSLSAGFDNTLQLIAEKGPPWMSPTYPDRQSKLCIFRI